MSSAIVDLVKHALMITGFVAVMMLLVEYANVLSRGGWLAGLRRGGLRATLSAAGLGVMPGCLGAFAVVAMYTHGQLSFGSVVAAMVATSGDEAFVMLALAPRDALWLFALLAALGFGAGLLTDALRRPRANTPTTCTDLDLHHQDDWRFHLSDLRTRQWRRCSAARGLLLLFLEFLALGFAVGELGPEEWDWVRVSLVGITTITLALVWGAPDHFLEEHLWKHVFLKHVPRLFIWTAGALAATTILTSKVDFQSFSASGEWILLGVACLVGLVPESGPHLAFVTLYAQGELPLSVLIANSVVQDGHGMLPLLAESRREFLAVKAINLALGILVGCGAKLLGY